MRSENRLFVVECASGVRRAVVRVYDLESEGRCRYRCRCLGGVVRIPKDGNSFRTLEEAREFLAEKKAEELAEAERAFIELSQWISVPVINVSPDRQPPSQI